MRISAKRRAEWNVLSGLWDGEASAIETRGRCQDVIRLGSGSGTPLVLIPGLAGGWKLMYPLAKRLARRHQVFIPSLRGDGNDLGSSRPKDLSDLAADLGATLEGLGLERPILFGVSFGATVALEYALENPGKLGGLALYGAVGHFKANLGSTIARRALERFPLPSDNRFVNQFFNILHGGKPDPGPLADFIVNRCWETDQAVMAHRIGLLEQFDVTDRLWSLDVPTTVISGSRDVVATPSRQKDLARSIPGASYEMIEEAGHIGFLSHRREVASLMAKFVKNVRRSYC